ncbi:AsmA family protein [Desulfoplanes sp. PS50]
MRWFLKLFLGIVAVFVLTATILMLIIEPDDLKPTIRSVVRARTGLAVTMDEPLKLSVLPRPELVMNQIQLTDPLHPDKQVVLTAQQCTVQVSFWPFCAGGYELGEVALQGLNMDMGSLAQAIRTRANAFDSPGQTPLQTVLSPLARADSGLLPPGIVRIERLRVQNATITGLPTLKDTSSAPVRIASLAIDDLGRHTPAAMQLVASTGQLDVDLNGTLRLSGDLKTLLMDRVAARVKARDLPLSTHPVSARISGTFLLEPHNKRIVLQSIRAELPGIELLTSSTLTWDQPSWEGGLILNARLPQALQSLGRDHNKVEHYRNRVDVKAHYSLHPDTLVFRDVHALIDGQTVRAEGTIHDFSRPRITFKAFGDRLDLTRYLRPSALTELPAWLKTSRIRGNVSVNRLELGGWTAVNVNTLIRANQGILRIYPLKGEIAEGDMKANIRVDMNSPTPKTTLRADVTNMQVHGLTETPPPSTVLLGSMNIFMDLTWQGVPWYPDPETLSGKATLNARNGTLVGFQLPRDNPASSLTRRFSPREKILPFLALSTGLQLTKGVARTRNLTLQTRTKTITGTGSYDLKDDILSGILTVNGSASSPRTMEVEGTLHRPHIRDRFDNQSHSAPPSGVTSSPDPSGSPPPNDLP